MNRLTQWLALLSAMTALSCGGGWVEYRAAPASTLRVRHPSTLPLKLSPGQEGFIIVQALNEDTLEVDGVQVVFLQLDDSRFELIDAPESAPLVRTTAIDAESGLRGAARLKFRLKPGAAYGTAHIAASLAQSAPLADGGVAPAPAMAQVAVEVVPDVAKVKLTPLPSTAIELRSGGTEKQTISVQATDEQGQPVNGLELYAEVFGGDDSPVTLVEGEATQPRAIHVTAQRTVQGLAVSGVAQWEVRLKGPVLQPMTAQVRFGLARSGGPSTISQIGKFDFHILPAEEPAP